MKDSTLTKALNAIQAANIPLAETLNPARRNELLELPGIGPKMIVRLQETASQSGEKSPLILRVLELLKDEWEAGCSGLPGYHHQPAELSYQQIAEALCLYHSERT